MVRYKQLGYLALNVRDVERSRRYYRDVVGLQDVNAGASMALLRCSDKHQDIALYPGEPGLRRLGFELESELQLPVLRNALRQAGVDCIDMPAEECDALGIGEGLRTWEPVTGATLDFYAGMRAPDVAPFRPTVAKIQRLGHLVLRSRDEPATTRFFTEVLNFKVSDSIAGAATFLRCFPNPFHHSLGILNGRGVSGFHHVNFMVSDTDDIGSSLWRLKKLDVPIVFGPGRHPPSESMFLYFLDPDGLTVEYSFGMEEFGESQAREPRVLPAVPDSVDYWGSERDPRHGAIGAIEQRNQAVA